MSRSICQETIYTKIHKKKRKILTQTGHATIVSSGLSIKWLPATFKYTSLMEVGRHNINRNVAFFFVSFFQLKLFYPMLFDYMFDSYRGQEAVAFIPALPYLCRKYHESDWEIEIG